MASKKKAYVPANILDKFIMQSGVLDTPIVCKCGQETTRRECESEPASFVNSANGTMAMLATNFYCPHCGEFIRCDSAPVPLMADDKTDESEDSDYDNE